MTDVTQADVIAAGSPAATTNARTRKRNAAEKRFRIYGMVAIGIGLFFLVALLTAIIGNGIGGFQQTKFSIPVTLSNDLYTDSGQTPTQAEIQKATTFRYAPVIYQSLWDIVQERGYETTLTGPDDMKLLISAGAAGKVRAAANADNSLVGQTTNFEFVASSRVDGYLKGRVDRDRIARDKLITPAHLDLVDQMRESGFVAKGFNWDFITGADASDSRAEQAGFGVSMLGSLFMMLVVLILSLPIGVAASLYLEEFAPKNWFTDLIEVNIANLAAVPSIVFGILGLAAFIQFAHLPQSAPLVGGLVLTLMTLPTIIISTRASLKAVPPSIRDAALGVGASKMQAVFHHVLPLAMPGILTGTIIGLAQALGETAPLLLIGMVGFIATNYPGGIAEGFLSPNSAMPAQIFEWAKRADPAFYERAWAGIIVLLVFLAIMNLIAIILRRRFERRW
ncbi:MAG: phosphate ABC transporter permease PstA [Pseudomonadota bacterium]